MEPAIIIVFILGYLAIALEHPVRINKAASAMVTGVLCWSLYVWGHLQPEEISAKLLEHIGEISGILFFLLGAMTIVELIDAHDGFEIITEKIHTRNKVKLLWIIGLLSFFLSAALDNLTTTIVMVSLANKIVLDRRDQLFFAGLIVIAANAGGAWSPIGDVTTTMLWIGRQITTVKIFTTVFVPSLICLLAPLAVLSFVMKGTIDSPARTQEEEKKQSTPSERIIVFTSGILLLLFVPIFKTITHLPPFMGMLFSLGIMWILTEFIHSGKDEMDKDRFSVVYALRKIDTPSILFFLGILLSVAALQSLGSLTKLSQWLVLTFPSENLIVFTIGLLSSIVDNVPLVAATQAMYGLEQYPTDHSFWHFIAYCTGTGGSALIIGSAAGVAAMGISKIDFIWYLKNITIWALLGYLSGAIAFLLQQRLFPPDPLAFN